jgi:type II secretory pathway component PulJ
MLVALAILSLMAAGLFASLGSSATHTERVKARLESQQALRAALGHIAADIEGVYWVKGAPHLYFTGKRGDGDKERLDELKFTAMRRRLRRRDEKSGDLVSITYSLSTTAGERKLVRTQSLLRGAKESAAGPPAALLDKVESVAFEYLDRESEKSDSWTTEEEKKDVSLPAAGRVTRGIAGGDQGVSMLIPIPMGLREPVEPSAPAAETDSGTAAPQAGGEGDAASSDNPAPQEGG